LVGSFGSLAVSAIHGEWNVRAGCGQHVRDVVAVSC
jgi:hypothetical protein